jgi:RNA polymerase sigma-70 factor (ECF subfamily)
MQTAVRGQLPDPVRRLPAQPEVAAQVLDAERAELRRLMERLADGDRGAFRPAFDLLWPRLRAFGLRYARADGEDAAQQALLRVFSRASEYDRERDALAWALGIAAWECRTFRRKRQRRREDAVAVPQPVDMGHQKQGAPPTQKYT